MDKPLLIFDGDCGFCRYWAEYWEKLTEDRVTYAPYQDVAQQFPQIPEREFQKAIQYVGTDGTIAGAAEASFLTLSHAPGKTFWLWLYQRLPGFAPVSEFSYAFIAKRRPFFHRISLLLWGRDLEPPRFEILSWIFLRLLGLLFFAAFVSFGVQAMGLIGRHGILPLVELTVAGRLQLGNAAFWQLPMLFWLDSSDAAIQAVSWGGAVISIFLVLGILPRLCLPLLCIMYLSLYYAGQTFMTFQWDLFLIETGFLGFLLCLSRENGIWLLRWLVFRFMFMGGAVKILSGDTSWRDLTAITYHFQTQPLPTPLGWYAHHLPVEILMFMTAVTLFVELLVPFLVFFPRRVRFLTGILFIIFESIVCITGNYNFFNFTILFLCISLYDDAALRKIMPARAWQMLTHCIRPAKPHKITSFLVGFITLWIIFISTVQIGIRFGGRPPVAIAAISNITAPLHLVNIYGPFAVMTRTRPEIIIEGSPDRVTWEEYTFKYKPGDLMRPPLWNIPHQPRLDWQMWFAALGTVDQNPWFFQFLKALLENRPEVMALMDHNPFSAKPPAYVRARLYDYRFTTMEEHAETGAWWVRTDKGYYLPPAQLNVQTSN
jgi:predicted DCC family thiol-disulfide oxidoreductase YuxK